MRQDFTIDEVFKVAKRKGNKKRGYLYVNPLQGKHVPADPEACLSLFRKLARLAEDAYPQDRLLVIGFAETATAIGAAVASCAKNAAYFLTTTREDVPDTDFIRFTEAHSHASEQRLAVAGLERALSDSTRIIFVEDEVTTGNTIMGLIRALERECPSCAKKFSILSILNSMSPERIARLNGEGIECRWLFKIPPAYRADSIALYSYSEEDEQLQFGFPSDWNTIECGRNGNPRVVGDAQNLIRNAERVAGQLWQSADLAAAKSILIIGTEECMFMGMMLGVRAKLRKPDLKVRFHASTRSPIEVSPMPEYVLHKRYAVKSMYDPNRKTYLYDLQRADKTFIVTDAPLLHEESMRSMAAAVSAAGGGDITFVRLGELDG